MGKKKRRLAKNKFATKFAHFRSLVAKTRGIITDALADGTVTEDEADAILEAQDNVLVATDEMLAVEAGEGVKVAPNIKTPTKKKAVKKKATTKKKKTTTKKKGTDA